jgi:hypothetical protein
MDITPDKRVVGTTSPANDGSKGWLDSNRHILSVSGMLVQTFSVFFNAAIASSLEERLLNWTG